MGSSPFATQLRQLNRNRRPAGRRWVFVAYDQLTDAIGPLSRLAPEEAGIVLVEHPRKARRRPYHRQKLALVLAAGRHFALEQARRGVLVRHAVARGSLADELRRLSGELGPLVAMRPAERELRHELDGVVEWVPHEGWLTTREQFLAGAGATAPWRMDAFYRHVRKDTGILMERGRPIGGRMSLDVENRKRWRGEPVPPEPLSFPRDAIKDEVCDLVERLYTRHPGQLDRDRLPATLADAETQWTWARSACLRSFGPFEDAMASEAPQLFHTRISALLNLHRLLPRRVLRDVLQSDAPIQSKEGFVRQLLGWREFVRHVHEETDGFRGQFAALERPGDGGYFTWRRARWEPLDGDGGAIANHLGDGCDVPPAYWGVPSGLNCLDTVVRDVWRSAWSHHITRLMILGNLATLLDVSPRALADWFWVAYEDAYDWVVEPNVLAMATFGTGPLMTTKPYVAGAAYIDRMSDYCGGCRFDPKTTCPVGPLYWAFLARHEDALRRIGRVQQPLVALGRRSPDRRRADAAVFTRTREALLRGDMLDIEASPAAGPAK